MSTGADIHEQVRERYAQAAREAAGGAQPGIVAGCGEGGCCAPGEDAFGSALYADLAPGDLPETAVLASLGCGNPAAVADLREGETVLDLGSGGGIDVLLSAKRVGPTGKAYGLDMTDEMLTLAEKNLAESGAENVKFLKGHIEEIPLPDNSVDVIISNCVINLSADKDQVLREAFRVLKPGGRFAVSDVVVEGELPDAVRADMEAYVGCVAGALELNDYLARLARAGFVDASAEPTRRYAFSDLESATVTSDAISKLTAEERSALDGRIISAFIRATKPMKGL